MKRQINRNNVSLPVNSERMWTIGTPITTITVPAAVGGERPLLVQAMSLAKSYDEMYRTTGLFIGGTQWHPFDHQRGYHPDPYWGGIYDAFRQKKYAYEISQPVAGQPPTPIGRMWPDDIHCS